MSGDPVLLLPCWGFCKGHCLTAALREQVLEVSIGIQACDILCFGATEDMTSRSSLAYR